jgi:hypothetical protein
MRLEEVQRASEIHLLVRARPVLPPAGGGIGRGGAPASGQARRLRTHESGIVQIP